MKMRTLNCIYKNTGNSKLLCYTRVPVLFEIVVFNFNRCSQFCLEASEDSEDAICVNIEGVLKNEKSHG
jgi:hypothetical protein